MSRVTVSTAVSADSGSFTPDALRSSSSCSTLVTPMIDDPTKSRLKVHATANVVSGSSQSDAIFARRAVVERLVVHEAVGHRLAAPAAHAIERKARAVRPLAVLIFPAEHAAGERAVRQ
jgi:hypothetical protein